MPPKKNEVIDVEPVAAEEAAELTTADRVKNLTIELYQIRADKKDSNKAYNDEIKRVDAEIKELLKAEGELDKE